MSDLSDTDTPWFTPSSGPGWLGLDVGGANLKIADGRGRALSEPFALWKHPAGLAAALRHLIERFDHQGETVGVAMTMTGELADCYATKADGVRAIVEATVAASQQTPVLVATTDDRWLTPAQAINDPHAVAAANWRLAARLVARKKPRGGGYWIDVGSTTTDVIPLANGTVVSRGATDTERLLNGELIYTGVRRTPVCAVVAHLPYAGRECPIAAEWFATTADAWLLLGELAEEADGANTADGRPLLRPESIARLARCVCADSDTFTEADAHLAATRIAETQSNTLDAALLGPADWVVGGGEGDFLVQRVVAKKFSGARYCGVEAFVGCEASSCFPAHAAAVLAASECGVAS